MKLHLTLAIALLSGGAFIHSAAAASRVWQSPVSGNFDGPGNQWNVVPGSGDIAVFSGFAEDSEFEVSLTQNVENERIRVNTGQPFQVTLNLNGFTYTATSSDRSMVGEYAGDNVALILTGGGTFAGVGLTLGNTAGSAGTLTLKGGAKLSTSDEAYFGNSGSGTFNITEGASYTSGEDSRIARNADSSSAVTISGASSTWTANKEVFLGGGANSTATLQITGGGLLETTAANSDGAINFGQHASSQVTVTISGEGSQVNGRNVNVGGSRSGAGGVATVTVTDKGLLKARTALNLDSKGVINLSGGTVEGLDFGSDARRVEGTLNLTFGDDENASLIKITNDVFLNDATLNLTLAPDAEFEADEVIRLLEYGGILSGIFNGYHEGQTVTLGGQSFLFSYELQGLEAGRFVGLTAIPEPGGTAMVMTGLAAVMSLYGYRAMINRGGRAE